MADEETAGCGTEASRRSLSAKFCKKWNIQERLTAMQRFGISIGPKEKKSYAKSNSIRDCRNRAVSRHHSDAVWGIHRREREPHSASGRETNSDLRSRRPLPHIARTITIIQRGG
jgi:hypothetical protein